MTFIMLAALICAAIPLYAEFKLAPEQSILLGLKLHIQGWIEEKFGPAAESFIEASGSVLLVAGVFYLLLRDGEPYVQLIMHHR